VLDKNGRSKHDKLTVVGQLGFGADPRSLLSACGYVSHKPGGNTQPLIDILNFIRQEAAAIWPVGVISLDLFSLTLTQDSTRTRNDVHVFVHACMCITCKKN